MTFKIALAFMLSVLLCGAGYAQDKANKPVHKVNTQKPYVALTFDDGPSGNTGKLLQLFEKEGVKATFFLVGKKVAKDPKSAQKIIAKGHEIGNHSYTHARLSKLDVEAIRKEINDTQKVIKEKAGVDAKVFRAPFLAHSSDLWVVLNENNLPSINSSSSVRDWDKKTTVEQIIERATAKTGNGSIILMHGWSGKTYEALPVIIKKLKEKGFQFVTVSELLASAAEK